MRALVFAAALTATQAARADTHVPEKARELANRGRVLHEAGDYNHAISAFNEAYALAPSPGLLFNLAQSYRLAGKCDDAAWMYRRYLDSNPTSDKRQLAETQLAVVEKCGHGGLRLAMIPPPPTVTESVPEPPRVDVVSTPLAVHARPAATPHAGERQKRIGIGLGIGGTVLLAGAAYFAYDAHEAADEVSKAYEKGGKWQTVASVDQRGQRSAEMAQGLGIVGGATVISGVIVYLVGRHYEQAQHIAVAPSRDGASVRMSWGF